MDTAFSVDVKIDKDQSKMLISGELIINHIGKIKESILDAVDFSNDLKIQVANPSAMDITFIQLMSSLVKSYQNKGKNCTVEGTLGEDVYGLVSNAGFNNLFKL
ncbi:hypothetical protein [Plebeiibacterium marinum]|uniref:STAS domain-containing protein n=1 Tax=Plebeiibacterium marinum TaxID=2992111 RepID=A0AAE3SKC2_9BACT|nr:hypothetical protein [Plebeiobacterium marinum]MCW3806409.1 hypothetical protein [Plebeiobacterium marinum]